MTTAQSRAYLDGFARTCPSCETTGAFHRDARRLSMMRTADERPTLSLRCACPCGASWIETYRLESVL